jgi:hypothetical protein
MKPWKKTPTREKLERIKTNWRPGMSARDIMVAIGAPSRNAVIGYYSRYRQELSVFPLEGVGGVAIRLSPEEKHRRTLERNRRYQAVKSIAASSGDRRKAVSRPVIAKPVLVPPKTDGVPLLECRDRRCKFAITPHDAPKDAHLFCGEVTEPGKSWCAWHEQIVWGRGTAGETVTVKSVERIAA